MTEDPYTGSKFESELGSKNSAVVFIITDPLWGSGISVMVDSVFGYIPLVVHIKNRGSFVTTFIKKKSHWPKQIKAQE